MNMVLSPGGAPAALTPADWLLQVGRLSTDAEELLGGLCELLVARGLPLERVGLHSRLLHPQLAGVRLLWRRGIGAIMSGWVERDEISGADAARYLHAIAHGNVERVYGLGAA